MTINRSNYLLKIKSISKYFYFSMFINLWITVFVRLYFYVYLFKKSQEKDAQNISPIFRLFNNDTSEELIFLLAMLEVSLLVLIIALFLFFT